MLTDATIIAPHCTRYGRLAIGYLRELIEEGTDQGEAWGLARRLDRLIRLTCEFDPPQSGFTDMNSTLRNLAHKIFKTLYHHGDKVHFPLSAMLSCYFPESFFSFFLHGSVTFVTVRCICATLVIAVALTPPLFHRAFHIIRVKS